MRARRVHAFRFVFALGWRRDPKLTAIVVALAVVDAALPVAGAAITGWLIDAAVSGNGLLPPLLAFAAVHMLPIGEARWRTSDLLGVRVGDVLDQRVMHSFLDPPGLAHLMDPDVQDEASRAITFWNSSILEGITSVAVTRLSGIGAAVLLAETAGNWPAAVLATVWVIAGRWSWDRARRTLDVHFDKMPDVRRAEYARDLAFRDDVAKDIRTFGLGDWVVDRYVTSWTRAMDALWRGRRRGVAPSIAIALAVAGAYAAVVLTVGQRALAGTLSVGALAVALEAALATVNIGSVPFGHYEMEYGLRTVPANERLATLVRDRRFALTGAQAPPGPGPVAIRFEHVSFAYPGHARSVLENVSVDIEAGQSLAIVGENGAGKTTLIKLLCRYFDPTGGRILVDGVDLATIEPRSWHDRVAGLFQDFVRYPLTVLDNVALGRAVGSGALETAAERAGVLELIEALPERWNTMLSRKRSEGVDLSGGEWQKIALARALLAAHLGAAVLILDEPTAQLDARAEAELYDRFLEVNAGATSIVISHRFSTVRRADKIAVLEDGRVIETGTHDELVALGGRYARMFRLQAARFTGA